MRKKLRDLFRRYLSDQETERTLSVINRDVLIVINGKQCPTGKTTLCSELNSRGYKAVEAWEQNEKSDGNSVCITITLNKPII